MDGKKNLRVISNFKVRQVRGFFVAVLDLCDPSTINIASASSVPKPLLSCSPSQVKWRQMILAWITKLEITFQLPGDSLIKDPLAGSTQQQTSISPLNANFHHRAAGRCMDSCGNLFHARVWLNRNFVAKCGKTTLSIQHVKKTEIDFSAPHLHF